MSNYTINDNTIIIHKDIKLNNYSIVDIDSIISKLSKGKVTIKFDDDFEDVSIVKSLIIKINDDVKLIYPKNLKFIYEYSFSEVTNLKEVVFQDKLESIGYRSFMESGLKKVIIPN